MTFEWYCGTLKGTLVYIQHDLMSIIVFPHILKNIWAHVSWCNIMPSRNTHMNYPLPSYLTHRHAICEGLCDTACNTAIFKINQIFYKLGFQYTRLALTQSWPIEAWTPLELWRCAVVSGNKTLAADPLNPVNCEVGPLWIWRVCPSHPSRCSIGLRSGEFGGKQHH